jgi:hypothetical protein
MDTSFDDILKSLHDLQNVPKKNGVLTVIYL